MTAERFKFHRQNQHESETVAQFVVELKRLALRCEFGTFLEEALRDRLVCGKKKRANSEEVVRRERLLLRKRLKQHNPRSYPTKKIFETPVCRCTIPSIRSENMPVQSIRLGKP